MVVHPGVRVSPPDGLFGPYEFVRELGARPNPVYVVRQPGVGTGGKSLLYVAERFAGGARADAGGEQLLNEARRMATLVSPNLTRVRETTIHGDDLVALGDFIEGEKLHELWRPEKLPLEIALRVIVDALTGVGALHSLRDSRQQPMKVAHGELSPSTIVFGIDGVARVLHAVSRRAPNAKAEEGSLAYLAPEVGSGDSYDARADVFAAGVLLWEALSGKRLFAESDPAANADRVRSGPLPAATLPEKATWARGLVSVAAKALAASPDDRWPTAPVMAAELRKAAGLKLAPASTAAAFARSAFGERVKLRREALDASAHSGHSPKPEPVAGARHVAAPSAVSPSEASLVDLTFDSHPTDSQATVRVAPSVTAQLAQLMELGSDSLIDAAAAGGTFPAPAAAGSVLEPVAASPPPMRAAEPIEPSPPPAPAVVAVAPVGLVRAEQAAAPILSPSMTATRPREVAPPARAPAMAAPTPFASEPFLAPSSFDDEGDDFIVPTAATRRRKLYVLGGVGALGVLVFGLAALRASQSDPKTSAAPARSVLAPVPTVGPAPDPSPPVASAAAIPASSLPVASGPVLSAPPPAASAAPSPVVPATTVAAAPAPRPSTPPPIALPRPAPVPPSAPAGQPRPKPTFDPNSL